MYKNRILLCRIAAPVASGQRRLRRGVFVVRRRLRRGAEGAAAAPTPGAVPCALPTFLPSPPDRHHTAAARHAP
jgi:hypothetical protein